jgi:hypothetical protein
LCAHTGFYDGRFSMHCKIIVLAEFVFLLSLSLSIFIYIYNSVVQEPEGSSPHSQQPATGPCPETVESNPHPPSQSP